MPMVVLGLAALLGVVIGLAAYRQLDIEAYPNPVPPLVEVLLPSPRVEGAEETERYVTIPLEGSSLSGMPGSSTTSAARASSG